MRRVPFKKDSELIWAMEFLLWDGQLKRSAIKYVTELVDTDNFN